MTLATEPPPEEQAAERSRRIEMHVERAVAHRQRMIRMYLALLVVPLAVAAAFLVWGRTDREIVAEEVAEQVDERVQPVEKSYREVAPILADVRGVGELLPEIRDAGERFQGYETGHRELQTTVGKIASEVEVMASEVEELKPAVEEVTADLRQLAPSVAAAGEARAEVEGLRRDLDAQKREVGRRLETLSARISRGEELTGDLEPQAGTDFDQPDDLQALSLRVQALQRSVEILQREVRALRAGLGDPR